MSGQVAERTVVGADSGLAPWDRRPIGVGAVVFAVLMALSPWYGFHRDELYFLDCARHLQGGYVDQPALTPLLARASLDLFGVSVVGLRLWPALAAWATIVVAGLLAREFGGSGRAQLIAAAAAATMPVLLAVDHLAGPTAFDMLAWAALALFVARVGRTGQQRWWLPAGLVLGVGLTNKHSIGLFAAAVAVGLLITGDWRSIANRWFVLGAAVAAAFTVPDLLWQAGHGWATISMTRALNHENGGLGNVGSWIAGQFLMSAVAMIGVWIAGLRFLWRSGRSTWRSLVIAYTLLFALFMFTTGAQIYYLAGAYVYLLAAGAVAIDATITRTGLRRLSGATAVCLAGALVIVLPVLPAADIGWTYGINQVPGESLGWPQLVATVDQAWEALPPARRASAVIFTADYGEAGALNELGRDRGLPTAVSAHNSEWWWGPGDPDATTVLAVAPGPRDVVGYGSYLRRFFGSVRAVATLRNPYRIHNEEWDGHVYVCTHPRQAWRRIWPQLRHYD
ncbi:MAG TPA: glycosyltransferase family 39 protein [Jatrophihabitantaceae bacterium]|nr:glycosyltransferase family 39 protein [Jatrophihabitantaceae bacterium]